MERHPTPTLQNCAPAWGITMVLIFPRYFGFYLLVALAPLYLCLLLPSPIKSLLYLMQYLCFSYYVYFDIFI